MERAADCINARARDVPYEICAVPEWGALHRDIEDERQAVRARFAGMSQTLSELDDVHDLYLAGRMDRPNFRNSIYEMEAPGQPSGFSPGAVASVYQDINAPERAMRRYLRFLKSLDAPRSGFEGRWISLEGEIRISGTRARIEIASTGRAGERCNIPGRVSISGANALIEDAPPSRFATVFRSEGATLGGWTLRAQRRGGLLELSERMPDGQRAPEDRLRPFCDGSAGLEGLYFPAR
jgi:hypothetical protein